MNGAPVFPLLASVSTWVYVGACVLLPLAWGIATEFVFRWLTRRHPEAREQAEDRHFFIDYHI